MPGWWSVSGVLLFFSFQASCKHVLRRATLNRHCPHTFSVEDRSGPQADQSSTRTLFCCSHDFLHTTPELHHPQLLDLLLHSQDGTFLLCPWAYISIFPKTTGILICVTHLLIYLVLAGPSEMPLSLGTLMSPPGKVNSKFLFEQRS